MPNGRQHQGNSGSSSPYTFFKRIAQMTEEKHIQNLKKYEVFIKHIRSADMGNTFRPPGDFSFLDSRKHAVFHTGVLQI